MKKIIAVIFCFIMVADYSISNAQTVAKPAAIDTTPKIISPADEWRPLDTATKVTVNEVNAPQQEKYMNEARQSIKDKKYYAAIKSLVKAKDEVNKLLGKELEKALPAKIGDWQLSYSEDIEKNAVNAMKQNPELFWMVRLYQQAGPVKYDTVWNYAPPAKGVRGVDSVPAAQFTTTQRQFAQLTLSISNCAEYLGELSSLYAPPAAADSMGTQIYLSEKIKLTIKGNRAFYIYSKDYSNGYFIMDAGASVIKITGVGITNPDIFKTLAESINYEQIKAVLK